MAATEIIREDIAEIVRRVSGWSAFAGETVLVTGAGGFIGSYLVRTLLELNTTLLKDHPVKVIGGVRSSGTGIGRLADLEATEHFRLMDLDLSEITVPALPGVTYIIHAASHASPRYYGTDPVGTILPNTVGTAALLASTRDTLKGFLFISSSEIYGSAGSADDLLESTPGSLDCAHPRSCYGEGKRAGEAICVAWHGQNGTRTFIARPFHTYGPGLAESDGRVFADFVYNVVKRENIAIRGNSNARRAFCYVSDAVVGLFTVLLHGQPGEAYNVANPEGELSVKELAQMLVSLVPDRGLSVVSTEGGHRTGYLPSATERLMPNVSKLTGLGWRPVVTAREGFQRTIRAHL